MPPRPVAAAAVVAVMMMTMTMVMAATEIFLAISPARLHGEPKDLKEEEEAPDFRAACFVMGIWAESVEEG